MLIKQVDTNWTVYVDGDLWVNYSPLRCFNKVNDLNDVSKIVSFSNRC